MEPVFFETQADFRRWLAENHDKETELIVGYYKVGSGRKSINWPQSVDEALCFGWIDGIRRSLDEDSYTIRFTPRKKKSTWSAVNLKRMEELIALGLVTPAGMKAYEARDEENNARIYAYENAERVLSDAYQSQFEANPAAWQFWQAQSASYRKMASWWVMSAKQEKTQQKRLDELIEASAAGTKPPYLTPPARKK